MDDKIQKKINQLTKEADLLVNRRMKLEEEQRQIEIRLTQIVGAVNALQEIKGKDNEAQPSDE